MEIMKGCTVYRCSYCKRRFLSRSGAIGHEQKYCKHHDSPNQERIRQGQAECPHENFVTDWTTIPGETSKEPNYTRCLDCGAII